MIRIEVKEDGKFIKAVEAPTLEEALAMLGAPNRPHVIPNPVIQPRWPHEPQPRGLGKVWAGDQDVASDSWRDRATREPLRLSAIYGPLDQGE